jgi:uncharacterized tellurite resistance protein B-like protein
MAPRSDLILALGKVMIAAAWADQDLSADEVNSLKDLLFHLPQLTAAQWAELDIYLHSPVGERERQRLLDELEKHIRTKADRKLALEALESVANADQTNDPYEEETLREIRQSIESAETGVAGLLGNLVGSAIQRRGQAAASFPNREAQLEDFVHNRVYYSVQQRLNQTEDDISLEKSEAELRTLSLAGGLMARVAHADEEVSDDELQAMVNALMNHWDLDEKAAAFVASIAASEVADDLDNYRLSREFYEATDREQRLKFLEVLFKVAAADGKASHQEIEDIRSIARTIKLSHKDFINAKLTLPRAKRSS